MFVCISAVVVICAVVGSTKATGKLLPIAPPLLATISTSEVPDSIVRVAAEVWLVFTAAETSCHMIPKPLRLLAVFQRWTGHSALSVIVACDLSKRGNCISISLGDKDNHDNVML